MKTRLSAPIRDLSNPWLCSVWFKGDAAPYFLRGNAGPSSAVPLLFVTDSAQAMTATRRDWFTFAWPQLILSHALAIGKRPAAVVHRLADTPDWSNTAAVLPEWKTATL